MAESNNQLTRTDSYSVTYIQRPEMLRLVEFGRVSASLIHEMSSPLTAAVLVLDQMSGDDKSRSNIRQVRRNLRVLERYVVAAKQQLKGESRPVSFSLTVAIHQVAMILSPRAKALNVRLLVNTIGSIRLYGDRIKFHQVIANLVNNAIEAYDKSTNSKRLIAIKVIRNTKASTVSIKIKDNGIGIKPKELKHIFEPFYSTKQESFRGGMGIGLDIVKSYVEQDFKGSIKASSNLDSGTEFTLIIPITKT